MSSSSSLRCNCPIYHSNLGDVIYRWRQQAEHAMIERKIQEHHQLNEEEKYNNKDGTGVSTTTTSTTNKYGMSDDEVYL